MPYCFISYRGTWKFKDYKDLSQMSRMFNIVCEFGYVKIE